MNAMERAEAWMNEGCRGRGIRVETYSGWGDWIAGLWDTGATWEGRGKTPEAAMATALRRHGIADFEEGA